MMVNLALCLAATIQFAFIAVLAHRVQLLEMRLSGVMGGEISHEP